jgi:branched-chain amino acid transport system substrate-binding protein
VARRGARGGSHLRLFAPANLGLAAVVGVALVVPFVASGFQTLEFAYALIFAMAILGLNILTGFSGQISLGHGAFVAIGAFTAAIGVRTFGLPYVVTIPLAALVCGVLGFAIGLAAGRLEGIYLGLATFALGVATPDLLKKQTNLTGGVKGITLPPITSPVAALSDDQFFYFLCLAVAGALFLLAHNILADRTGRAWRAVRDGELAAAAFGINVGYYKTLAFALSAAYAGVAGSLYGLATAFVSTDAFPFQLSIGLLVGAVVGGIGTIGGALIGGLLTEFLPIYAQQMLLPVNKQLANAAPGAVQGILLLVVLGLARGGVAGLLSDLFRRKEFTRVRSASVRTAFMAFMSLVLAACSSGAPAGGGAPASGGAPAATSAPAAAPAATSAKPAAANTASDVGVTADNILIGGTDPLSGPAAAYGTIAKASDAYFNYVNDNGGVNGRKITYKYLDDGYNPAQTVPLTKQLVEQDQVFLMYAGLGTQPQTSVRDYLNGKKVPQVFVATGATTFSAEFEKYPYTFGWQPVYQGESLIYAQYILKNTPNAKIGVIYQNDDYGQDYLDGLVKGLGNKAAEMIVDKESNDVGAPDLSSQVLKLKNSGADTLFVLETPSPAIKTLVAAFQAGWHPTIYLNAVSAPVPYVQAAQKAAGDAAAVDGIITVAYTKDPADPAQANDAGIQLYKQIMTKYFADGKVEDSFNIYGMATAYSMVDVLKKVGPNLTRQAVMDTLNGLSETDNPFMFPGIPIKNTKTDHYTITQEYITKYDAAATYYKSISQPIDVRGQIKFP